MKSRRAVKARNVPRSLGGLEFPKPFATKGNTRFRTLKNFDFHAMPHLLDQNDIRSCRFDPLRRD
jgi:hypothetical protein